MAMMAAVIAGLAPKGCLKAEELVRTELYSHAKGILVANTTSVFPTDQQPCG
jgi:hypothetical protein